MTHWHRKDFFRKNDLCPNMVRRMPLAFQPQLRHSVIYKSREHIILRAFEPWTASVTNKLDILLWKHCLPWHGNLVLTSFIDLNVLLKLFEQFHLNWQKNSLKGDLLFASVCSTFTVLAPRLYCGCCSEIASASQRRNIFIQSSKTFAQHLVVLFILLLSSGIF